MLAESSNPRYSENKTLERCFYCGTLYLRLLQNTNIAAQLSGKLGNINYSLTTSEI